MAGNRSRHIRGVLAGLLFLLICHISGGIVVTLLSLTLAGPFGWLLYHGWLWRIWFWQLFYVIPAIFFAYTRHRDRVINGIAIGAVITFIVNIAVGRHLGWIMWFNG